MAGIEARDLVLFQWDDDKQEFENEYILKESIKVLLENELKLMKVTNWNVLIPTSLDFLQHSFQFATFASRLHFYVNDIPKSKGGQSTLMHRRYDRRLFFQAVSILDKAVMDYQHLEFASSLLAAAVFYITIKKESNF